MTQADQIREAALAIYVQPARLAGHQEITIRAGDLHREMGLSNSMPAVCGALRSRKFEELAGLRRVEVTGPAQGANVYFRFETLDQTRETAWTPPKPREETPSLGRAKVSPALAGPDLRDALVLVSCVKSKLPHAAPARLLYCSDLFTKMRQLVEAQNASWFILSALHGLVPPDREIAPYELTLNTMGVADRRAWAARVLEALEPELQQHERVVFFAGQRYREFLVGPIRRAGVRVDVPMEGMAFGEQLAWLSARQ